MATAGPNAGTGATSGSPAWSTPTNVGASDDTRATCGISASGTSGTLTITGFGFAVPAGATINGITVAIERRSTTGSVINDFSVRLVKAGVAVGTNTADSAFWPLNTDSVATYGNSTYLWGTTWTDSDVNASNFGVAIVAANTDAGATRSAQIDYVTITIDYTASSGGQPMFARHGRLVLPKLGRGI